MLVGQRLLHFGDNQGDVWPRISDDLRKWLLSRSGCDKDKKLIRCAFTSPLPAAWILSKQVGSRALFIGFWVLNIWNTQCQPVNKLTKHRFALNIFFRILRVVCFPAIVCLLIALMIQIAVLILIMAYMRQFLAIMFNAFFILHSWGVLGIDVIIPGFPDIALLCKAMIAAFRTFLKLWEQVSQDRLLSIIDALKHAGKLRDFFSYAVLLPRSGDCFVWHCHSSRMAR